MKRINDASRLGRLLAAAESSEGQPEPDETFSSFEEWVNNELGISLYPAQEEAALELALDHHVILATPTGTGKSLVALAAHVFALAGGHRSVYTAPIKALVSEKFFDLIDVFGPDRVGMVTGDSSINPDAPILCCTAEILANLSLRDPETARITRVIMDEFHYYADRDRGWAWQVPLLLMNDAQFLLMSATLGDVTELADDLTGRTGREVALVTSVERPVPLTFEYRTQTVHEAVEELNEAGKSPVYIVHFAQAQAVESAQALASIKLIERSQRDEIARAIGDFRFGRGFGTTLSRLVRSGIGVHHAGMLPKYRRLVETLAQRGLLRVICGTDTLGVGINVPIRTVLLTALTKFDGEKMRQLTAREFHQIAGRAGRAGFDTEGDVVVLAPGHEVENARAQAKAAADPKRKKKAPRKAAPKGFVTWGEGSLERLVTSTPEQLVSRMNITHSMILSVIARHEQQAGDTLRVIRSLIFDSHEPRARQFELARTALEVFRTLKRSGVVTVSVSGLLRLTIDLQPNFALNQPLSPFALAAIELIDPDSTDYPLDVISIIESTLENPRQILRAQEHRARGEAVAAMKADGIEYEERMELLENVTHPRPLADLLGEAYDAYVEEVPWARDYELSPKSIVRDMVERAFGFRDFVSFYELGRSEGTVLRYLSDAYRAISQTVPGDSKTSELEDLIDWLGEVVRQVDSSLLDEWEALTAGEGAEADRITTRDAHEAEAIAPPARRLTENTRAFTVMVRNALFRRVRAAAFERYEELESLDGPHGFGKEHWREALDRFYSEYDEILIDGEARSQSLLELHSGTEGADDHVARAENEWRFRQVLLDPDGDRDWGITGVIDLRASDEEGAPVVIVQGVAPLSDGAERGENALL